MKIGFHSHANENLFSYERMSSRTRFEKEDKGDLKWPIFSAPYASFCPTSLAQCVYCAHSDIFC